MRASVFVFCIGLLVVDVAQADSLNVRLIGSCDTPGWAFGVAVIGDYAYVAGGDSGLRVISVSDPAHPVEVGYYVTPGWACGVAAIGDNAYVAHDTAGLQIYQFYGGGVEETPNAKVRTANPTPTIVRGVLRLETSSSASWLLNAAGRRVAELCAGANDVSRLSPGVYFVRQASGVEHNASSVTKVVLAE